MLDIGALLKKAENGELSREEYRQISAAYSRFYFRRESLRRRCALSKCVERELRMRVRRARVEDINYDADIYRLEASIAHLEVEESALLERLRDVQSVRATAAAYAAKVRSPRIREGTSADAAYFSAMRAHYEHLTLQTRAEIDDLTVRIDDVTHRCEIGEKGAVAALDRRLSRARARAECGELAALKEQYVAFCAQQ